MAFMQIFRKELDSLFQSNWVGQVDGSTQCNVGVRQTQEATWQTGGGHTRRIYLIVEQIFTFTLLIAVFLYLRRIFTLFTAANNGGVSAQVQRQIVFRINIAPLGIVRRAAGKIPQISQISGFIWKQKYRILTNLVRL